MFDGIDQEAIEDIEEAPVALHTVHGATKLISRTVIIFPETQQI